MTRDTRGFRAGRAVALVAVTLLLAACLGPQVRINDIQAGLAERVCVVSLVGDVTTLHAVAPIPTDSVRRRLTIAGFEADALVTERLLDRLAGKSLTGVPMTVPGDLPRIYDSAFGYPRPERVRETLAATAKSAGCDMTVSAYRQQLEDFITGTVEKLSGYGAYRAFDSEAFVYAAVLVEVLDGKGRVIGRAEGRDSRPLSAALWARLADADTPLDAAANDAARRQVAESLITAVLLAAQEAGVSN